VHRRKYLTKCHIIHCYGSFCYIFCERWEGYYWRWHFKFCCDDFHFIYYLQKKSKEIEMFYPEYQKKYLCKLVLPHWEVMKRDNNNSYHNIKEKLGLKYVPLSNMYNSICVMRVSRILVIFTLVLCNTLSCDIYFCVQNWISSFTSVLIVHKRNCFGISICLALVFILQKKTNCNGLTDRP
jgi:hypothetical protein